MATRAKFIITVLIGALFLQLTVSSSEAEYRPAAIPEQVIESMVAEKPDNHDARIVAGFMHFDSGRFLKAEKHFAKAAGLTPKDPYDQAWRYMAQMRQNAKTPDERIRTFINQNRTSEFVFTDIAILLGDITPDKAIQQAKDSNDLGNLCEAHYYVAQRLLVNGEQGKAKKHFAEAVKTKQESYWEYKSALAYLEGMK